MAGGDGNDLLRGGSGGDDLSGGPGNDTIHSDTGPDRIDAGPGDDDVWVNSGSAVDTVDCGEGVDTIHINPEGAPGGRSNADALREGRIRGCENVIAAAVLADPSVGISWSGAGSKRGTDRNDKLNGNHAEQPPLRAGRRRRDLGRRGALVAAGVEGQGRVGRRARQRHDLRRARPEHDRAAATATTRCRAAAVRITSRGGSGQRRDSRGLV